MSSSESSDELRAQALAGMRAARDHLGQETIHKIAENVQKLEQRNAAIEAAKARVESEMDAERAMIEILGLLEDKK